MKFYNFNDYLLQCFGVLAFKNFAESALSETSLNDVTFFQHRLQLVLSILEWECNGGFLSADSFNPEFNCLVLHAGVLIIGKVMFLASCFQFHALN